MSERTGQNEIGASGPVADTAQLDAKRIEPCYGQCGIAALKAELDILRTRNTEVWSNPEKWMRWCDHRILERAEVAEASIAELREEHQRLKKELARVDGSASLAGPRATASTD